MKRIIGIFGVISIIMSIGFSKELDKFLDQEVALHYYNQGKLLKCKEDENNYIIVTNNFQASAFGSSIIFNKFTQNGVTMVSAKSCILYKK